MKEVNNMGFGLIGANMNYRCSEEDLSQRVLIVARDDDGDHNWYFKVPGLWTNVIQDYLDLVQKAYPNAKVFWQIDKE